MTIVYGTNDASDHRSMHEEVLAIEALQVCDPTNLGLLWRVRGMMFLMSIIHVICV